MKEAPLQQTLTCSTITNLLSVSCRCTVGTYGECITDYGVVVVIKRILASLFLLSAIPPASFAQLTDGELFGLNVGLTAGSLKTVCVLYETGTLTREETRLYAIGYMISIRERETGVALAGNLKGLQTSKNQHPNCPLPD